MRFTRTQLKMKICNMSYIIQYMTRYSSAWYLYRRLLYKHVARSYELRLTKLYHTGYHANIIILALYYGLADIFSIDPSMLTKTFNAVRLPLTFKFYAQFYISRLATRQKWYIIHLIITRCVFPIEIQVYTAYMCLCNGNIPLFEYLNKQNMSYFFLRQTSNYPRECKYKSFKYICHHISVEDRVIHAEYIIESQCPSKYIKYMVKHFTLNLRESVIMKYNDQHVILYIIKKYWKYCSYIWVVTRTLLIEAIKYRRWRIVKWIIRNWKPDVNESIIMSAFTHPSIVEREPSLPWLDYFTTHYKFDISKMLLQYRWCDKISEHLICKLQRISCENFVTISVNMFMVFDILSQKPVFCPSLTVASAWPFDKNPVAKCIYGFHNNEIVDKLVELGADMSTKTISKTFVRLCSEADDIHVKIEYLRHLISKGINVRYNNDSALKRACINKNLSLAELLVKSGCDIEACRAELLGKIKGFKMVCWITYAKNEKLTLVKPSIDYGNK